MDRGHELTDERIKEIEERLRREYEQAAKEIREKTDDYLRRFETKDKIWQKWVEDKKKTPEEYAKWRFGQITVGKRWDELKERIANDQLNVNKIARNIIQHEMPDIFALNANYAGYQVEHDAKIDTTFTLYSRDTVDKILRDDPDLLLPPGKKVSQAIQEGKAKRWEKQKIQSVMTQGILQGESIPNLASRLAKEVADSDYKAAVRNARTMSTNAQNAGRYDAYDRIKGNGVDLTLEWAATLDNRTRHEHRMMHGQRRDVGEPFEVEGIKIMYPAQTGKFMSVSSVPQEMIWNCFVGDTNVATDSEIQKSYKHKYSGELITINTASGINFTCTPNHPILTPRGWVAAALLNKGDDLLVTSGGDGAIFRGNGNVNHVHSTMKALHETLLNFGGVIQSPMSNFNFHGDIPTSDVEIVCKEGELGVNLDARIANSINKSLFKNPDTLSSGKGHFMSRFGGVDVSTLGFVSRARKALSLLGRSVRHTDKHCLGAVTGGDSVLTEYPVNNLPTETIIRSNLLNGLTRGVFVDNIVSVNKSFASCHVYNLQTENGYYLVGNSITHNGETYNGNMVIAKNCRCTILAWVKGFEHDTITKSDKMGKMSFEEWLEAKERPEPILRQKEKGDAIRASYIRKYGGWKTERSENKETVKPSVPEFIPSETIADAEEFAMKFMSGGYKSAVNYQGIDLKYANEFNRAINDVLSQYDPKYKLRSVQPMNMRSKQFKGSTAEAAYQWGMRDLFFNKAYFKTVKDFAKHEKQYQDLMDTVISGVDKLIEKLKGQTGMAAQKKLDYAEALRDTRRATVGGADPYSTIVHELGHYLDDSLFRVQMKADGFDLSASYDKYAKGISAYATATTQEYVAESFAAYINGETENIDPDLINIFVRSKK